VNINTNETVRMSKREAMGFRREGDFLYYVNEGSLYRISMRDGNEDLVKRLTQTAADIRSFEILGGRCYWMNPEDENLYDDNGKNMNGGAMLEGLKIAGDQDEYMICTFTETESSKYHMMIIDKTGAVVFKTSDAARTGSIDVKGKTVTFVNRTTGTLCRGVLK
jgi:hypothetical protein